jgi:hypothetical protein
MGLFFGPARYPFNPAKPRSNNVAYNSSRKWKMYVFGSHPVMIPEFADRSKCC